MSVNLTLPVISKLYEAYKLLADISIHLKKPWRYSLGHSLDTTTLDALSQTIMAKNAPKPIKATYLIKAISHIEIATLKLRLLLELKLANETKIFQLQAMFLEVGRMLGGWLRSLDQTKHTS